MSKIVEANEVSHLSEDKNEGQYVSYDAPPLDFSFKNIKHISCTSSLTQK